ncbi:hypothetical protein [Wolbachia pipientis]|uniref:hypothetical protein n=1 Tax=Wolbachia pipientis TaxID=955 RepID=UPI0025A3C06E|nr:hypothetical protein [Wolbachia pipientis]MDM8334887.1 hypothetical protein [Wolbachia pipientis]
MAACSSTNGTVHNSTNLIKEIAIIKYKHPTSLSMLGFSYPMYSMKKQIDIVRRPKANIEVAYSFSNFIYVPKRKPSTTIAKGFMA